jgi:hypothetical protein
MTASVQYWRLPDEEGDFVEYLQSLEPTMAIPLRTVETPEALVWKPVAEALHDSDNAFLITPSRFVSDMKVHRIDTPLDRGFTASVSATPAIHYSRGRLLKPRRLSSAALSADWTHLAEDGKTVVDKPADFVRWARNVMQWVRRVAPGWYLHKSQRITPKAEEARAAGMEMIM